MAVWTLRPRLHLDHFLGRDLDAADLVLEAVGPGALTEALRTFFSKPEYVWTMYHCFAMASSLPPAVSCA